VDKNKGATVDTGQEWRDQLYSLYVIVIESEYKNRPKDISLDSTILFQHTNTNALNLFTSVGISPHPIPLPSGERGG
jgi:hypothetical protein